MFGIVSFGHSLGADADVASELARYTTDVKKVTGWGYRRFHRAEDGQGLTDLAVAAGMSALERAGVAAADVDLVVLAIADIAEYLYWDPAAAVAARLGAHAAEAMLLGQACGAGVMAFDAVAGKLATHPDYTTALLVAANRVCESYWNRMESNTTVASDGAAAAVLSRTEPRCRWLATEIITDGRYADLSALPVGGAARPFADGHGDPPPVPNPFRRMEEFFGHDVRAMYEFVRTIMARNRVVLERACKAARLTPADVRHVVHFHDNYRTFTELAGLLGVPLEHTNVELALDHGHLGAADQTFGLERLLAMGAAREGEIVALSSMGSGMHWVCTLLRV